MRRLFLQAATSVLVVSLALLGACTDEPDGDTLVSVYGDPPPTIPVFDASTSFDMARPRPDTSIPPGACGSFWVDDGDEIRVVEAFRCEFARQTWRESTDAYLTIYLESETEVQADGTVSRDVVQIILDDVPDDGFDVVQPGVYDLRFDVGVNENFAVYSGNSAWLASTGQDSSTWGESRGTVTITVDDGSAGTFTFDATTSDQLYTVSGSFRAFAAASALPEPPVR